MDEEHSEGAGAIVVGTDGSSAAGEALTWALRHAAGLRATVHVVRAYDGPDRWPASVADGLRISDAEIRREVTSATCAQVGAATAAMGGVAVPVRVNAVSGRPVDVLGEAAQGALMLVVGHRGLGSWRSVTLGSVGLAVLFRAPCPVTIVRRAAPGGAVVVGVDGSVDAAHALRYGLEEAARRGARLVAVAGSALPTSLGMSYRPGIVPDVTEYRSRISAQARSFVDRVVTDTRAAGVAVGEVDLRLVPDSAVRAVLDTALSVGADLVVVGHTGRGAVASRLLGSVGYELALHSSCTLTIVPDLSAVRERAGRETVSEPLGPLPIGPVA